MYTGSDSEFQVPGVPFPASLGDRASVRLTECFVLLSSVDGSDSFVALNWFCFCFVFFKDLFSLCI